MKKRETQLIDEILDYEQNAFRENFPRVVPVLKQYDCKKKPGEGDFLFSCFLTHAIDSYDEEQYSFTLEILNNLHTLIDPQGDSYYLIHLNIWKLRAAINVQDHELCKYTLSLLQDSLNNYLSQSSIGKGSLRNIFKEITSFYEIISILEIESQQPYIDSLFIKTSNLVERHSPFMGFILELIICRSLGQIRDWDEKDHENYINTITSKIKKIDTLDKYLIDKLLEILDDYHNKKNWYPIVNIICIKTIDAIKSIEMDPNLSYYLIALNSLRIASSRRTSVTEVLQVKSEIIRNCELVLANKWPIPQDLLERLQLCIGSFRKYPVFDNFKHEFQILYIQMADESNRYKLINELIDNNQFNDLEFIFNKIGYTQNMWQVLKIIPIALWGKLTSIENPYYKTFIKFLIFRNETTLPPRDFLIKNTWIEKIFPNVKKHVSTDFSQKVKYLFNLNNGFFLLGTHPSMIRDNNLFLTKNLTFGTELRKIILLFCVTDFCRGVPGHIILDILEKYRNQTKPLSACFLNTGACAAHYFAINYSSPIDQSSFNRITHLFAAHLSKSVDKSALAVSRSLRELIYQKAKTLGKRGIYLTDTQVKRLVLSAKRKDNEIHNIMTELGLEIKQYLFKRTQLLPLDLSIYQLVTALSIMWVTHFNQLRIETVRKNLGFMARQIAGWVIKLSRNSAIPPAQHCEPPLLKFSLPVRVKPLLSSNEAKISEEFSHIQIRQVQLTANDLATFFSANPGRPTPNGKRKRSPYYRPWSFIGSDQRLPHIPFCPALRKK